METLIDMTYIRLVNAIARIREEWQDAARGQSLMNVTAPVGLVLADFVIGVGLAREARAIVLGADLLQEYRQMTGSI